MKILRHVLPLLLLALPLGARAACTVNLTGVAFGIYDTFSPSDVLSTGTVDVRCQPTADYTVTLSTGSGSFASRTMTSGSVLLPYNLYLDASRVTIWGDGTGGTGTIQNRSNRATHTIYGRIPALQNVAVGSYSDTIVVTVIF